MRFFAIGHVSRDEIGGPWRPGGSAFYAAAAAARLGADATLVAPVGPLELETFERECAALGVRLLALDSPVTTIFRRGGGRGGLRWRIGARAPGIGARDVREVLERAALATPAHADVVLLGCIAREIAPDVLEVFRGGSRVLAAQGFLREWDELGRIEPREWAEPERLLAELDAVVVSQEDLLGQTGSPARWSRSTQVVVTRAAEPAVLWRNGRSLEIPGFPATAVDDVGAGDTFTAALALALAEGRPAVEAVRFAHATASLRVGGSGLGSLPDRAQVEERLWSAAAAGEPVE